MSYGVGLRNGVAFALGTISSLTSGGGLRPSLLLNFLSGTLDSRITFSRGTQATQYTSNGTLQYAPNNLLTYSNQADNAAWTKSNSFVQTNFALYSQEFDNANWQKVGVSVSGGAINATIAPDGTLTADALIEDATTGNHWTYHTPPSTVSATHTFSAYYKASGRSFVGLRMTVNPSTIVYAWFNLATGAVGTVNAGLTATISAVGNGWYRCTITGLMTAATPIVAFLADADNSNTYTGTSGLVGAYIWGAQLVQGSVPGDYVATTSAALPVLYADYNGVVRAKKLCENTATSNHVITQSPPTGLAAGVVCTISFFAKASERSFISLEMNCGVFAQFNLLTQASTSSTYGSGVVVGTSIVSFGNGWYRCSLSGYGSSTATTAGYMYLGNSSYTGDGSSGIYIADAQLEAGSTVQAYNDTTSAAYYGPRFDYDPTNYVRQNLLLQSEDFTNASWTKSGFGTGVAPTVTANQGVAPDGTLTADRVDFNCVGATSPDRSVVSQTYASATVGAPYTSSLYIKAFDATSVGKTIRFTNESSSVNQVLITLTDQWQRVPNTFAAGSTSYAVVIETRGTVTSSATASVLLWGAQLNTGSTALTYTATTTAPYTLVAARGLLIEEQRANLLLQSNDFLTSWSPTNVTRTLASTTGPDGTLSGVKLEATAAAATAFYQQVTSTSTSHTFAVYVKQGTGAAVANTFGFRNITTLTNLVFVTLNFSTGAIAYSVGSTGASATNIGNGWWRVVISVTAGITASDLVAGYVGWSGAVATAGDFLYAYGAQIEAGAFATSYIPTVASQVTRSADSASITTLTPWFNPTEGAIFLEYVATADPAGTYRTQVKIVDGGGTNYLQFRNQNPSATTATTNNQVVAASVTQVDITSASLSASAIIKTTLAYKVNDFAAATNGAAPITDASGSVPTGLTTLTFSGGAFAAGQTWYRNLSDYPTRLPNATLQGLTV